MLSSVHATLFANFEWVEIFYIIIGSFIGIFIPIWLEKLNSRKNERDARRKILGSLNQELDSVKELIEIYRQPEHQYDIFSFSTFVWESIIAGGMLPDMLSDKNIRYELLMDIYANLALLNELHDEFCQCTNQEDLPMIYSSILEKRDEVYEKILRYRHSDN